MKPRGFLSLDVRPGLVTGITHFILGAYALMTLATILRP